MSQFIDHDILVVGSLWETERGERIEIVALDTSYLYSSGVYATGNYISGPKSGEVIEFQCDMSLNGLIRTAYSYPYLRLRYVGLRAGIDNETTDGREVDAVEKEEVVETANRLAEAMEYSVKELNKSADELHAPPAAAFNPMAIVDQYVSADPYIFEPGDGVQVKQEDATSGGKRYSLGKLRFDLLPPEWTVEIARVLTFGAQKYSEHNWQAGMDNAEYVRGVNSHLLKWRMGASVDEETGGHHLAHAAVNLLMAMSQEMRGVGKDTRGHAWTTEPLVIDESFKYQPQQDDTANLLAELDGPRKYVKKETNND